MLMCFLTCGGYFVYDNPAELETIIEDKFNISTSKYSLLYSIYSLPNFVLPLIGGLFIEKYGENKALILYCSLAICGQTLLTFGADIENFPVMLLGRGLFGAGAETLWVIQSIYITRWFFDQELGLSMALGGMIPNMFSVASGQVIPIIY